MKIVIDNIVYSLQSIGGVSCVFYELTNRLLEDKYHQVKFVEKNGTDDNFYHKKLIINNNQVIRSEWHDLAFNRFFNPQLNIGEPYIFHSSYYRTSKDKLAINVTTVHDFTYEYFRKVLGKKLHCLQKNKAIRHSDAIVCISENTKRDLLKFLPDIDESKINVIYNGVSEDYHVIDKDAPQNLPFPSSSYLVFVGSRISYKNFDIVVRSIAQTNMNLVIVGSLLSKDEKEKINNILPQERYKCMGFLSNQELSIIYNHALALVYPSSYEGFGIPILEAQRAGCSVIALNASSIPEVIGETPLLMNELTETEFLSKLEMLSDKDVRTKVVSAGFTNAKRFSWDKMFSEYLNLYKVLWASGRGIYEIIVYCISANGSIVAAYRERRAAA